MFEYQFFKSPKQENLYVHIQQNIQLRHAAKTVLNKKKQCMNQCKKQMIIHQKNKNKNSSIKQKNYC